MEKINVAELLKDCPKGMELDCAMFDDVQFSHIQNDEAYPIVVTILDTDKEVLTAYGTWNDKPNAKCVIFPKGKTTWEGFVPPCKFKNGDVLFVDCSEDDDKSYQYIFILNRIYNGEVHSYCHLDGVGYFHSKETYLTDGEYHPRFATEEEKAKLFQAIKDDGYKWNAETKTLLKLIQPKFKVGDRIILKDNPHNIPSIRIKAVTKSQYILENEGFFYIDSADEKYVLEDKFNINTLVPFESRVLVRGDKNSYWKPAIFGCYIKSMTVPYYALGGTCWEYCIPYEGNERLLGTTNDCDEFYKTWK